MTRRAALAGDDLLADEPAGRQRQEQRPEPDRANRGAMNLHGWITALFVLFAIAGCAQVATEQGQAPNAPYPPEFDRHTYGGVDM
jgi:hypothetical protein